jgi:hypothetical protein
MVAEETDRRTVAAGSMAYDAGMGIFDRFRKPSGPSLLAGLTARYGLQRKACPEASLMGDWWEGQHEGRLLAFIEAGKRLTLFLGGPAENTEIYLVRATPDDEADLEATRRDIERIAGPEGAALAAAFRLGATPPGALFDIPQLRLPALRDGVPRLSASVIDVQVYETFRGLALNLGAGATPETVAADLAIAHGVLKAVEPQ